MNKRRFFITFIFLLILLPFFMILFRPDEKLHFIFCDVGQGDAMLLAKGFNQVVIDGGPDEEVIGCLSKHMPFWDRTIELVINTHPDSDHLRGLIAVLERYNVELVLSNSRFVDSDTFDSFHRLVYENSIPVHTSREGDRVVVGEMVFDTLWPSEIARDIRIWQRKDFEGFKKKELIETNDESLVFWFSYGSFDVLLMGDVSSEVEKVLVSKYRFEGVDVLKVGHHGSDGSTGGFFLDAVRPRMAVISVGNNYWNLPGEETLKRLKERGIRIRRTDLERDIELVY